MASITRLEGLLDKLSASPKPKPQPAHAPFLSPKELNVLMRATRYYLGVLRNRPDDETPNQRRSRHEDIQHLNNAINRIRDNQKL